MIRLAHIWPRWAFLACVLMLGAAHAFEAIGHMLPCTLCLEQRDVYWWAMAVAGAGAALGFTKFAPVTDRVANLLLTLTFLTGMAVAAYHAGVEWKWWPGPAACSGGGQGVSAADLDALLKGAKGSIPACDRPAWVFLGLSMAGWNAVASLGFAVFSALATSRGRWPASEAPAPA